MFKKLDHYNKNYWWLYSLLPTFFVYLLIRYILDPNYFNIFFYGINLGIHEAGHYVVFRFFGDFLMTLGGSFFECIAPLLAMITFYKKSDFFAISFCFGWLATAFFNTATYISDAQEMSLTLLFGEHDWHLLLSQLGLLQYDNIIGLFFRFLGLASLLVCIFWGYSIVWTMRQKK